MDFRMKTEECSYTRARTTWRLGAVLAATLTLGAGAAVAQSAAGDNPAGSTAARTRSSRTFSASAGGPAASDFAGQYAAAASSSARLGAVMDAIRTHQASQAAWLISDFSAEPEPAIRAWMIRGAADLNAGSGRSLFEQGLKDPSAWVRLAAVESLGKLGTPQAVLDLSGILSAETNPGVRQSAAFWLGQIGTPAAVSALGQSLNADLSANVRAEAARALAHVGNAQARRLLLGARNDADARVRQIAGGR